MHAQQNRNEIFVQKCCFPKPKDVGKKVLFIESPTERHSSDLKTSHLMKYEKCLKVGTVRVCTES